MKRTFARFDDRRSHVMMLCSTDFHKICHPDNTCDDRLTGTLHESPSISSSGSPSSLPYKVSTLLTLFASSHLPPLCCVSQRTASMGTAVSQGCSMMPPNETEIDGVLESNFPKQQFHKFTNNSRRDNFLRPTTRHSPPPSKTLS